MKSPVESQAWFQSLPTGHHTRWFCERTAKVGGNYRTKPVKWSFFGNSLLKQLSNLLALSISNFAARSFLPNAFVK
jgi:hypothetical protein